MQKVYLRKTKTTSGVIVSEQAEKILHFSFQGAMPQGHTLALNTEFGTLSLLVCDEPRVPRLLRQEQFTNTEMSVLMPLLEQFPYYCPYEVLYASFYGGGKTDEKSIEEAREHLEEAMEDGTWDQEMRPIRCALSRTRVKMRTFNVDISSILATGYILMLATKSAREERVEEEEEERELVRTR
jgi:hypothetical protein